MYCYLGNCDKYCLKLPYVTRSSIVVITYLIAKDALRWLCSLCNRVATLGRQSVENGASSGTETVWCAFLFVCSKNTAFWRASLLKGCLS